ncbi:hypothetical protein JHK85_056680 [Glycine max]|nr:hypothetical protein JHK85_056680 [Glycine max]
MKGSALTGPISKECADLWPRIASAANAIGSTAACETFLLFHYNTFLFSSYHALETVNIGDLSLEANDEEMIIPVE